MSKVPVRTHELDEYYQSEQERLPNAAIEAQTIYTAMMRLKGLKDVEAISMPVTLDILKLRTIGKSAINLFVLDEDFQKYANHDGTLSDGYWRLDPGISFTNADLVTFGFLLPEDHFDTAGDFTVASALDLALTNT